MEESGEGQAQHQTQHPGLNELPDELLIHIAGMLNSQGQGSLAQTNRHLRNVVSDPDLQTPARIITRNAVRNIILQARQVLYAINDFNNYESTYTEKAFQGVKKMISTFASSFSSESKAAAKFNKIKTELHGLINMLNAEINNVAAEDKAFLWSSLMNILNKIREEIYKLTTRRPKEDITQGQIGRLNSVYVNLELCIAGLKPK